MKQKNGIKLLYKMAVLLFAFIVIAMAVSICVVILNTDKYIETSVERSFSHKRERIIKNLKEGIQPSLSKEDKLEKLNKNHHYIPKADVDTIIQEEGKSHAHLYRYHEEIIELGDEVYLLTLKRAIDDFVDLKSDIIKTLTLIFATLSVLIIIFSTILSRFLFQPFNSILHQMQKFKVGESFLYQDVKTSTSEFQVMQRILKKMAKQTENDYLKLKEYTENMAHELQTPLAIIRNKVENLIGDEKVMASQTDSIKVIYDETNQLSKLGSTLRLLTKIENNEFVKRINIFSKQTIEIHIEKLRELAGLKSVSIHSNLNEQHTFYIDPFLLEIILKNLIRNAIIYAAPNSVIQVKTAPNKFSISNRSEANKKLSDNLFQRFSKGKSNQSSLGLGLAIVKKICELNNLTINYQFHNSLHTLLIVQRNEIQRH